MNRILIIQTAFLGDVILATPVISELNKCFPNAQIDFLVKKGNESLLSNNSKVNEVIIFDKAQGKWKNIIRLINKFRKERYDLVINLHRFGSSGLIAGLSKGKKRYGFNKNPFSFLYTKSFSHNIGEGTHEVERNLSLIKEFGATKLIRPELFPSENDYLNTKSLTNEEYYCFAPASVWFTKQLPRHKWIELIQKISDTKRVLLIGGNDDMELCSSIAQELNNPNVVNLAGKLSLLQSATVMQKALRNYVNDSGPLHIASAMNARVTVFFCSTIENFGFGPLSDDAIIVEVNNLECRPCGLHGFSACPKGHFKCGELIEF